VGRQLTAHTILRFTVCSKQFTLCPKQFTVCLKQMTVYLTQFSVFDAIDYMYVS